MTDLKLFDPGEELPGAMCPTCNTFVEVPPEVVGTTWCPTCGTHFDTERLCSTEPRLVMGVRNFLTQMNEPNWNNLMPLVELVFPEHRRKWSDHRKGE